MNSYITILRKLTKDFHRIHKDYGFSPAFYNLEWWLNFYLPSRFRYSLSKRSLKKKTKWLIKYIEQRYKPEIEKYLHSSNYQPILQPDIRIWVFWGQGESEMPSLVKACFSQLCTNYNNIVLVTNSNVRDYIDLPQEILDRAASGNILWAHVSDIIRNKLLYKYGGLWLDATVWATDKIPFDELMQMPFFSANGETLNDSRSCCFWTSLSQNWSTWCMWSNSKHYPLLGFVGDVMEKTALSGNTWPDYVYQDFLIYYALNHSKDINMDMKEIKKILCNNRNTLAAIMGQPYNPVKYKELCKNDFVFKLSYRTTWPLTTADGTPTFYGKLICSL